MSEVRSGSAVGRQRPRLVAGAKRRNQSRRRLRSLRSAEAVSGVVKRPVPRSSRAEPRLCEAPTRRKLRKRTRERTRCGCTQFRLRVAEVDRTHRVSCLPGGQKPRGGCESKQGASRKEARSIADAGHEPREGESVCGTAHSFKRLRMDRQAGFGSLVHETTEGVFGPAPMLLLPAA